MRRSQRNKQVPQRLQDYEMFSDTTITEDGDALLCALVAEAGPISLKNSLANKHGKLAMEE